MGLGCGEGENRKAPALSAVTLSTATQKPVVMLQRLADIFLRLIQGHRFGDKASYSIPSQYDFFTLIRLLLAHDGLDRLCCQLAFLEKLSNTDCLIVGRGTVA